MCLWDYLLLSFWIVCCWAIFCAYGSYSQNHRRPTFYFRTARVYKNKVPLVGTHIFPSTCCVLDFPPIAAARASALSKFQIFTPTVHLECVYTYSCPIAYIYKFMFNIVYIVVLDVLSLMLLIFSRLLVRRHTRV